MLVGLYTVRVKLDVLGIENYGIYNIVAGVMFMFTFLNVTMTNATQRFLNFYLGKSDIENARNSFSISFAIHLIMALIIVVLAETVGLWFFINYLVIPPERLNAALVVYQFSIALTVIELLLIPYKSVIFAYERMSFFSILSIIEALFKLLVVFLLQIILYDKLIVYSFLVFFVGIILFLVQKIYCNKNFEIARFRYCKDKELTRQLTGFSGWSVFGGISATCAFRVTDVLLNLFFGVLANAANGIATQVNIAVSSLVRNFQTAFIPQIYQSYSSKDNSYFINLIFSLSKVSFYLLFIFFLPLFINADFILNIWLKEVPNYAIIFTQLTLLHSLETTLAAPLITAINATGKIKKYQIIDSILIFTNLPLVFLFFYLGFAPYWLLTVRIGISFIALIWRIFFCARLVNFNAFNFILQVLLPVIVISAISCIFTLFIQSLFFGWQRVIISCFASTISIILLIYFIGINKQEKNIALKYIHSKLKRSSL